MYGRHTTIAGHVYTGHAAHNGLGGHGSPGVLSKPGRMRDGHGTALI